MRRKATAALVGLMSLALMLSAVVGASAEKPEVIPGQFIVVLKERAGSPVVKQQKQSQDRRKKAKDNQPLRDKNLAKLKEVRGRTKVKDAAVQREYADVLVGFAAKLSKAEAEALRADPDVEAVYEDYAVSLGPITPEANTEEVQAAAQTLTCAVKKAGGPIDGSTKPTWIWILDTGIDLDHPDLNVQAGSPYAQSFIFGESVDDGAGHGTHVAGIAAARSNAFGVVGVSSGAKVVPVKVLSNTGSGSFSGILAGLNHVAQYDLPKDVVNMSLGAFPVSNCESAILAMRDAIRNLGATGTHVVMAAGNESGNAEFSIPGCIDGTNVHTVASITCAGTCSSFTNLGKPPVDWCAVGSNVYSTYKYGGYATLSGTSMASPVIAGVIHARGGAPVSAGNVTCKGLSYRIGRR